MSSPVAGHNTASDLFDFFPQPVPCCSIEGWVGGSDGLARMDRAEMTLSRDDRERNEDLVQRQARERRREREAENAKSIHDAIYDEDDGAYIRSLSPEDIIEGWRYLIDEDRARGCPCSYLTVQGRQYNYKEHCPHHQLQWQERERRRAEKEAQQEEERKREEIEGPKRRAEAEKRRREEAEREETKRLTRKTILWILILLPVFALGSTLGAVAVGFYLAFVFWIGLGVWFFRS